MDPFRLGLVATRIHYFQLVARLGSIRQAAQALNVAPSSISRILRQLEEELGTPLFERVRQRLKLTSAGELLLYHARTSLGELNRALTEIGDLHGLHRGSVSIAVIESVARGMMPDLLEAFWSRHPGITVDVKVTGSQAAADMVAAGDCDLALVFDVRVPRAVRRIASASLPLGLLARPDSRFADRKELRLSDLGGERIVVSDASLMLGISLEEVFSRLSIDIVRRSRTNSIGLMIDMALRGLGAVLQTRVGVEREIADGSLAFVPLKDNRINARKLMLLARPEKETPDAAAALVKLLAPAVERLNAEAGP